MNTARDVNTTIIILILGAILGAIVMNSFTVKDISETLKNGGATTATSGEVLAKMDTMEVRKSPINPGSITISTRERLVDTYESFERNGESSIARGPATGQVAQIVNVLYEIDGITNVSFDQYEIHIHLASMYTWKDVGERVLNRLIWAMETSPEARQRPQNTSS